MPQERRRRPRPRPVEQILRQEAGFGCCVCGHPIFQYHHIVPYTEKDPHYRPDDMMILCPNHHDEATQQVMSEATQREHKAHPYNIVNGYAGGMLTVDQARPEINIGGSVGMIGEGSLIEVDRGPLMYLATGERGTLLLDVALYDEEDRLVAEITENEWVSSDPLPWDIDFGYRDLTIRSAPRRIALSMDTRVTPIMIRADLWRKGKRIQLGSNGVTWSGGGGGISELSTEGFMIAISTKSDNIMLDRQRRKPARVRDQRIGRNQPCWCGSGKKLKKCHGE
jgi:hypothetical protein